MKYNELVKGMYVKEGEVEWVKLRIDFDVEEFSKMLISRSKVAVSPGAGFGIDGDKFVRFSLIENEQRIRQAIRGIKNTLGK